MEKLNVSAEQAARMIGVSNRRMLTMLEAGEVPAYREGSGWKIPLSLLKSFNERKALDETKERRKLHKEVE